MNFLKQRYQTALEGIRAYSSGSYSFEEFAASKVKSNRSDESILEHFEAKAA